MKKSNRTSRFGMSLSILALLTAASCSCGDGPTKGQRPVLRVNLQEDPTGAATYWINFGDVPVGSMRTERIEVRNPGATDLHLIPTGIEAPFSLNAAAEGVLVDVGGSLWLSVDFAPQAAMETPAEVIVRLETNEKADVPRKTVRITGRGVPPMLDCSPDPLDFGRVVRETDRVLTAICTNPLDTTLELGSASFRGTFAQAFSVTILEDVGDPLVIAPGGKLNLDVRFRASGLGANDAALVLRDVNGQLLADVPVVAHVVQAALVIDPSECLQFGYVDLGGSLTKELMLENVGTEEIQILNFRLIDQAGTQYSVHTQPPMVVRPGEAPVAVPVEFHPELAGKHVAQLELVTDDIHTGSVNACLSGFGGGPKLSCVPERVDFGAVAIGSPMKRTLSCMNDGAAPEGVFVDPLVVEGLSSDNEAFSAVIVDESRQPTTPKAGGYELGEGLYVEVTFSPLEEGHTQGLITIASNAAIGEPTAVSGEGRDLPSCDFSIIPPELRFGTVERGASLTRDFTLQNHLETECLVGDVHLTEGSHSYFSMEPIDHAVIAGKGKLKVPVTFAPLEYVNEATGEVVFQISNQEQQAWSVPLRGTSASPCVIVEPEPLDFGKAGLGCMTRDRQASIRNVCSVPVTVTQIGVEESDEAGDFYIRSLPPLPLTLESNQSEEFTMRFGPSRLGVIEGLAHVEYQSSGGAPTARLLRLRGEGAEDLEQTDRFVQLDKPKVDVLWVIDNSGSMSVFQKVVQDRISRFTSFADAQDIDYQIAATSTGLWPFGNCGGGADCGENGRFFPINASDFTPPLPRILSRETPNLENAWRRIIGVGTGHFVEQSYEAALRALSPPLINEVQDSRPGKSGNPRWRDGNAGFLREDAALSIVFLTDEVDQSFEFGRTPLGYVNALRLVKGPRYRHLFKISAITQPHSNSPVAPCGLIDGQGGDRLIAGVEETGGEWFNICTPLANAAAWDAGLERISRGAFSYTFRFELRGQPAGAAPGVPVAPADIEVWVNGRRIYDRDNEGVVIWTYDPVANAVDFAPLYGPKPGAEIDVVYQVACIQ